MNTCEAKRSIILKTAAAILADKRLRVGTIQMRESTQARGTVIEQRPSPGQRVKRDAQGGLQLFPNQSSGVLTSAVWGHRLVDNPAGRAIARGDAVSFISLAELMA